MSSYEQVRAALAKTVRNERDPLERFRANILLENVKGAIADPTDANLQRIFRQNAQDYAAFKAGRA